MEATILQTRQLRKEYRTGRYNPGPVIPGLDMQIRKGEFVIIMGSSGSGKSTLLYLLAGLEEATGGEVNIKGNPLPPGQRENAMLRRTSMGIIFQQNNLIPNLTLLENILVAAFLIQKNRREAKQKALRLMSELGIQDLRDRYPSQVSGGEQQRCSIARALVNDPDIVLADEPTGSLNSSATENVLETFSSLHRRGQTIVMVTHEVEAACYGERVVYLSDGKIMDEFRMDTELDRTAGDRATGEKALLDWLIEKGW